MQQSALICPSCESPQILRSKIRSLVERMRKRFTHKRPYRCLSCDWRGWMFPVEAPKSDWELERDPPLFTALDARFPPIRRKVRVDERKIHPHE